MLNLNVPANSWSMRTDLFGKYGLVGSIGAAITSELTYPLINSQLK
ncbi:hypothetical protein [Fibrella forsythiae]|uniref:Uncharacterized protein n=1 Tax=Fibrella forsythiae TaxID=2817061 RepID=A0ABS3JRE1_9BACT|nr:hypothetical protein [Fibrella forsythiae]MBO0952590.1 hypothetical protein [Fibrella forsythiae]